VRKYLCGGGCACAEVMWRINPRAEFVQNEGSTKDILILMCFDVSILWTRAVLILLLIDSMECISSYNESLRTFCT